MTKIILLQQTMSLLTQQSIDELVKRGTVKVNENNIPYISIDVEEYLQVEIKTITHGTESIQV